MDPLSGSIHPTEERLQRFVGKHMAEPDAEDCAELTQLMVASKSKANAAFLASLAAEGVPDLSDNDDVHEALSLLAKSERPRVRGVGVADGVAEDDDEVGVGVEALQEPHAQQRGRRLLEHERARPAAAALLLVGLVLGPVVAPLAVELGRDLGRGELGGLGQVRERVEGEEARPAERIVGREDRLRVASSAGCERAAIWREPIARSQ